MPWDGAGTFNRTNGDLQGSTLWQVLDAQGVRIRSDHQDIHDQDIATGLNNCLLKDGTNFPTSNLPMATFKHTGVGDAEAGDQYATVSQVQTSSIYWGGTSTGTGEAYEVSTPISLVSSGVNIGEMCAFIIHTDNTIVEPTLSLNGGPATEILKSLGFGLQTSPADMPSGKIAVCIYTFNGWTLLNPSVGAP